MSELEELFKQGESLQEKMRVLFNKNNLPTSELRLLPKEDFEEWKKLHEESNILTKKISLIVSQN
jgi:hypothetical protein